MEETNKLAVFNAGIAQSERIHHLQEQINLSRHNPFLINPMTMTYSFQNIISSLNGLLMEAWGKLNQGERALGNKLRQAIEIILIKYPIVRIVTINEEDMQEINY